MAKFLRNSYRGGKEIRKSRSKRLGRGPLFGLWVFVAFLFVAILMLAKEIHRPNSYDTPKNQMESKSQDGYIRRPLPKPSIKDKSSPFNVPSHPKDEEKILNPSSISSSTRYVSIIIDDMGRSVEIAKKFVNLPYPLAFAVLPYEPETKEVVKLIKNSGKTLLLHMPMEPHGYPEKDPGEGALLLTQSRETQRKLFLEALERVPGAVGVNNHMGSRFTEDREAMEFFLSLLKEKGLFFVDSATTNKTVACDVAKSIGVKCFRRDVFIDHEPNLDFVNAQIEHIINMADQKSFILAIGHPHRVTFEVLTSKLRLMRDKNIELVSIK